MFAHVSFVIPVKRLRETGTLPPFYRPGPAQPFHVHILPKKAVERPADISGVEAGILIDLFSRVRSRVDEFHLPACRSIVNGGAYQDFPQLNFHLISEAGADINPSL